MRTAARLTVLSALVLAQACGSLAGSGGPSASPSPSAPPGTVMVTQASDRQTVTAHVGDHIQIALGTQYNWQLDPPDGVVLVHPIQNYLLVRGTQAIWLAKSVGRSTIKANGSAVCASGQPCPLFLILFTATVDVLP